MAESDIQIDEAQPDSAGLRLQRAREAARLSLGDVAARTKIAERHLTSIEQGRYADLASRTYAVGFARAYARAVGLDERDIAQAVRDELAGEVAPEKVPVDVFEPGDPARVPGSKLAWVAAFGAVAVIVLLFTYWGNFFSPSVSLPSLTADRVEASASPAPSAAPAVAAGALVTFTALEPNIWVQFTDAAGAQIMQKQMAQGESFTLPAGAEGPLLRTGRPDALQVSIGGRIVAKISDKPVNVKDVPVSAAALLARGRPVTAPAPAVATVPAAAAPVSAQAPAVRATAVPQPARPAVIATAAPAPRPPASAEPAERPSAAPSPQPAPAPSPAPAAAAPQTSTVSE